MLWRAAVLMVVVSACGSSSGSGAPNDAGSQPKYPDCMFSTQEGELCSVSFFCDAGELDAYCSPADGGYDCSCRKSDVEVRKAFSSNICKQPALKRLELASTACQWLPAP